MVTAAKKTGQARSSANTGRTIVYRGIKIKLAPMGGKRSPTAEAIRDALRLRSKQARGQSAHG
jgi:hypothetical protein